MRLSKKFQITKKSSVEINVIFPAQVLLGAGGTKESFKRSRKAIFGVHVFPLSIFCVADWQAKSKKEYSKEYGFGLTRDLNVSIAFGRAMVLNLNPVPYFGVREWIENVSEEDIEIPLIEKKYKATVKFYTKKWKYRLWPFVKSIRMATVTAEEPIAVAEDGAIRSANIPFEEGRAAIDYALLIAQEVEGHRAKNNFKPK